MKLCKFSRDTLFLENKMNVHACSIVIFNEPTRTNLANIEGFSWSIISYSHCVPLCDTICTNIAWLPKEEHHA